MLATAVRRAADRFGDRPAFVMADGSTLTYRALDRRSDQVAANLAERHGIGPGAVVALRVPSDLSYVIAYAALAKLGAAAAGINPGLAAAEQDLVVAHLAPTLVLRSESVAELLASDERSLPATDQSGDDPSSVAAIVFTSGTTGRPKGAVFRNHHLAAIARLDVGAQLTDVLDRAEVPAPAAQLASTQFAHVGFMTKLPWYLAIGLTTYVLTRWRADDVIDLIERERIATLGAIAPQIALLLRSPRRPSADLSSLATLIVGGAASPPALVAEATRELGVTYSVRYSSTESGGVGLANDITSSTLDLADSIGRPRPGVEVRITDDGELCLRSDAVFDGYWNDPAATETTLRDGWLHTADLAERDDRGLVRLIGRRSDMYIRGGYNVHPSEVEAVLGDHPEVAQVAVVPRPDDVMGEVGVAVVVPANPTKPPTLEQLHTFAEHRLARWKLPASVVVVAELPLTAVSKPDRVALRRLVAPPPPDAQGSAP